MQPATGKTRREAAKLTLVRTALSQEAKLLLRLGSKGAEPAGPPSHSMMPDVVSLIKGAQEVLARCRPRLFLGIVNKRCSRL